jgi:hypothetical protein
MARFMSLQCLLCRTNSAQQQWLCSDVGVKATSRAHIFTKTRIRKLSVDHESSDNSVWRPESTNNIRMAQSYPGSQLEHLADAVHCLDRVRAWIRSQMSRRQLKRF